MFSLLSCFRKVCTTKSFFRRKACNAIAERVEFYRSQLGFPEKGSEEFKMMSEELQTHVEDFYRTSESDVKSWLARLNTDGGNEGLPFWLDLNKAISDPYDFVKLTLHGVLDEMEKIALKILKEAAARAGSEIRIE